MRFPRRVQILPVGGLVVLLLVVTAAVVRPQGGGLAPDAVGRRMPVVPRVQVACWSPTSSGPAALGTVLAAYGLPFSSAQLETMSSAVGRRATLGSIGAGAEGIRQLATVVEITPDLLPQAPLPAVAEGPDGEFRVFISSGAQGVEVFDPLTGSRGWVAVPDLAGIWTGRLLLVHPLSL